MAPPDRVVAPPSVEAVTDLLRAVIDPELGSNIVDLGMASGVTVSPDGDVRVTVKLTIAGCPLRVQIRNDVESRISVHPGVRSVKIEWGEMTAEERSETMLKARWNAREEDSATRIPSSTRILAVASGKGGVGKSSVTINLAVALAARGLTVGVLDADIWGFSIPRMAGINDAITAERAEDGRPLLQPNLKEIAGVIPSRPGLLKVVSMGNIATDEGTALMWRGLLLNKAVEQFLKDVNWGDLDYLLIDMPPGTGDVQMGLARMLPRTDLLIVTTPATAAQKVAIRAADMARRSFLRVAGVIENMSSFTCEHGETYALFGQGGGQALADEIGVPLLGQVPLEPSVSAGGDAGEPVSLTGVGPAADAFRAIAEALATTIAPPVNTAGCSARLLDAVAAAFDAV